MTAEPPWTRNEQEWWDYRKKFRKFPQQQQDAIAATMTREQREMLDIQRYLILPEPLTLEHLYFRQEEVLARVHKTGRRVGCMAFVMLPMIFFILKKILIVLMILHDEVV